jgi:hypothetical protein
MLDRPVHIPCFFHVLGGSMHIPVLEPCAVGSPGVDKRAATRFAVHADHLVFARSSRSIGSRPDTGRMESKRI